MPNFFTDNPDLQFHFDRLDLEEAVSILEHDYEAAGTDDEAPGDYEEAIEVYRTALELVGDISANFVAPRSAGIDLEGVRFADGEVTYAKGTREARDRLAQAGLMGVILPRRHGGLNFPATIYMMMIEMVSRADASIMTLFGYQDVGEAISRFGTEEQAQDFLPAYSTGEKIGAMVLSEPGAGSDLQAVRLQAHRDDGGQWRLKGVKHFISNGNGDVLLVLARSEPGVEGMFGLSLFACHGDPTVRVNRVEEKMGLHGSPTCELYFDDTPAELIGKRRFGLVYVIHTLNHARFSVAAQGLGIAEAAYGEAVRFARQREQFGKVIYTMPPIANLLIDMRVSLDASRTLLYAGAQWLDHRNKLEDRIEELKKAGHPAEQERIRFRDAAAVVDLLSPMVKYIVTEAANRTCYDAQQIHGGMGYMREMPIERLVRDVRITSIYEGTSQVQVGLAVKPVLADLLSDEFDERESRKVEGKLAATAGHLVELRSLYRKAAEMVRENASVGFRDAAAKDLVDIYGALYCGHLLLEGAAGDAGRGAIARRYAVRALANAHASVAALQHEMYADVEAADRILR